MPEPTDELTLEIMRALEIDTQWICAFDPNEVEAISQARTAGRRAGRALKLKVLTRVSRVRNDGLVNVLVVVNDDLNPEDEERIRERSTVLMRNMWSGMANGTGDQGRQ